MMKTYLKCWFQARFRLQLCNFILFYFSLNSKQSINQYNYRLIFQSFNMSLNQWVCLLSLLISSQPAISFEYITIHKPIKSKSKLK